MSESIGREKFKEQVFKRDKNTCVVPGCSLPAVDAHHLIDRECWPDEGYHLDNGVALCEEHHIHAELGYIHPHTLRAWSGIKNVLLPTTFDGKFVYDKWGNKMDGPKREEFEAIKYPHTPYWPYSPSVDEKDIKDCDYLDPKDFINKPLVATIKMDGSNVMLTTRKVAARNGYDATHKSFDMVKSLHAPIRDMIPFNVEIFGEWLYAKHSIHYAKDLKLDSLLYIFGIYDRNTQMWAGWDEVRKYAKKLGFPTVPVVKEFIPTDVSMVIKEINSLGKSVCENGHEGIVVRSIYPYHWSDFRKNLTKYVRPNHVQTDTHWSHQKIVRNEVN